MEVSLDSAVQHLKEGDLVAVPTDTVYGIAADFRQDHAIQSLYDLKGRDAKKPVVILTAHAHAIASLIAEEPPGLHELTSAYWPGPLTLALPVHSELIPETVRAGLPTTGFRIPDHPLTRKLLEETGPMAVTSANRSGEPPATSFTEVKAALGDDFPTLDGGPSQQGVPSTVLAWNQGQWVMVREGAVSKSDLEATLGQGITCEK